MYNNLSYNYNVNQKHVDYKDKTNISNYTSDNTTSDNNNKLEKYLWIIDITVQVEVRIVEKKGCLVDFV